MLSFLRYIGHERHLPCISDKYILKEIEKVADKSVPNTLCKQSPRSLFTSLTD